ncbi:FAD-dependent oxidoreductase [Priestia flexa]
MERQNTDVLIVGAGPTGLLAALELMKRGISCIIIEKKNNALSFLKRWAYMRVL